MDVENLEIRKIEDRCKELKMWIATTAPECFMEEKHLIEGSRERGYWAHGYLTALLDVLRLLSRERFLRMFGGKGSQRFAA
jgi:hypothetical protein